LATGLAAQTPRPGDAGLRRETGLTGATWAAETSVIGSGWLFAAWKAAYSTGTASILAWILAGTAIIILALVHAELGSMYPVAGGTARFPHFTFGTSFGFFSWVQAITVPAIESSRHAISAERCGHEAGARHTGDRADLVNLCVGCTGCLAGETTCECST
jgi:hypothetical protein